MTPSPTPPSALAASVGGLALANPILTASGTYGSGKEYAPFEDVGRLGGVVTKSVTLKPTAGNPPPRVVETPGGMLNAIGLQNEGVEHFVRELLPPLRRAAARVAVNCAGKTEDDYVELVRRLEGEPVDALEINISCPNVKAGGAAFGADPVRAAGLVEKLRRVSTKPLWVKLTPQTGDFGGVARAVAAAGADALTVANTYLGIAIDIDRRRPILGNVTGGLSGPCVHPLSLRLVWEARRAAPTCPIVASGGVWSVREVVGFLLAGASATEVGTANFVEPGTATRLVDELAAWLADKKATVAELVGAAHEKP